MSKLMAVLSPQGDFRVHAAGCRDLGDLSKSQHADPLPVQGRTREEIAVELYQNFIDEESMTPDEALDYVTFLPCTGL